MAALEVSLRGRCGRAMGAAGAFPSLYQLLVALMAAALAVAPLQRATAAPPGSGWYLIQADEFSGSSIDRVKWDTQYEWGRTHNHDAYMLDSNVTVDDGLVTLEATREDTNGKPFSSGVLSTHGTFRYTYGYMEMQMKLTDKRGSWPAFWMLNAGWPPEIDVMEYPLFASEAAGVNEDRYYANSYWYNGTANQSNGEWIDRNVDLGAGFHTFGLEWTSTNLRYYFDGVQVKNATVQTTTFQNMYTIFNLAVGGDPWAGLPSTAQWAPGASDAAQADWYRVWQKPTVAPPATTWTYNSGATGAWTTDANWSTAANPRYERQRANFGALSGRTAMTVTWNDSKTVGELHLSGTTSYTLGGPGGDVENLMFADSVDGWGLLSVDSGAAGHLINARIDAWSNVQINHGGTNILRLAGDIYGQARPNGASPTGGIVRFTGTGQTVVAGSGRYQRDTRLDEAANVQVTGRLYVEDTAYSDAAVRVSAGSRLQLANLNNSGIANASLGYLPSGAAAIQLDNGTLALTGTTTSTRTFTLLGGGGTLELVGSANVSLSDAAGPDIVATSGGDLTLAGANGSGTFMKSLGGTGRLIKQGTSYWKIGGANTYTGATLVNGGILEVTGQTGTGTTTVADFASLRGSGTVRGLLDVEGELAPGSGVGTLNAADVTLRTGSLFSFQILDANQHDLLAATGALTLEPGVFLSVSLAPGNGYVPTPGDTFTIATAAGGVAGTFGTRSFPELPGFTWAVDTLPNSIIARLVAVPNADFNADGFINGDDLLAWQRGNGITSGAQVADGDANRDGKVDGSDLYFWQLQFGQPPPTAMSVPEPGSGALLAMACAGLAGFIRRRGAGNGNRAQ